jgi:hypothetical protein
VEWLKRNPGCPDPEGKLLFKIAGSPDSGHEKLTLTSSKVSNPTTRKARSNDDG